MSSADVSSPLDAAIAAWVDRPGGLLPALRAVHASCGEIDEAAIGALAAAFNVSRAEVHGVATFYPDLARRPQTRVRVCRAEACQARGGDELWRSLGGPQGMVDSVFCVGNCALGPSMLIGGQVVGRATAATAGVPAADSPRPAATSVGEHTVRVSNDTAATAVGADRVADELRQRGATIERVSSAGALWLEPVVEVRRGGRWVAYGPVHPGDVGAILDDASGAHRLHLGTLGEHHWFVHQTRHTTRRLGTSAPLDADAYVAGGGRRGVQRALEMTPRQIVAEITASGLRGRGGAAFPAGVKWQTVGEAPGDRKYVCVNADEGDSGTFVDRMLLEGDPFAVLDGMVVAARAVGASQGFVYLRSEYPAAATTVAAAIDIARQRGWLGAAGRGPGEAFDVELRIGAGAYICGEETSMLESLEGKRGEVRAKPPLPAHAGLFGCPTVVNNVLTIATAAEIMAGGADAYAALGIGRSRGTCVVQLGGNVARGGLIEVPFGTPLRTIVESFGGGTASGRPVGAVQVGGPLGAYLHPTQLDLPLGYEEFSTAQAMLGHGGVVVFDDTVDMSHQARWAMEFCAEESCGKCTPCRIGSTRGAELIEAIRSTADRTQRGVHLALLDELCETMSSASLCALGGLTPLPVRSALTHWGDHFERGES